jgi:hypothetical protein
MLRRAEQQTDANTVKAIRTRGETTSSCESTERRQPKAQNEAVDGRGNAKGTARNPPSFRISCARHGKSHHPDGHGPGAQHPHVMRSES